MSRGEEIAAPGHVMTEFEAAMREGLAVQARFGRFEDWTPEQVAYLIEALADGMARDWMRRFDGYWGAAAALRIASAFVEHGDQPEAAEVAAAEIGILARYALDSTFWGNCVTPARPGNSDPEKRPLVRALQGIERAASPIVTAAGTADWFERRSEYDQRQRESGRCISA